MTYRKAVPKSTIKKLLDTYYVWCQNYDEMEYEEIHHIDRDPSNF